MTLRMVDNVLELIGETPLVRLGRVTPLGGAPIYAKLEYLNPGGSVKDRAALRMLEAAEVSGELTRDKIVLEATSGNTGIGLAMVCAVKGYRMLFTMSESASEERRKILRAYGADILLTPAHLATDGAIEEAYRLAREEPERYFLVDQFNNYNNVMAHYQHGTADEIHRATQGRARVVVATLGTSGTAMGLAKRLHELDPAIKLVAVEPYQGHKIQGLKNMKESLRPGIFDPHLPDQIVNVDDDAAYAMARRLAREEGIFVGMSAGAAVVAAVEQARGLSEGMVVAILPDGGERYLSTPLFVSEKVPEPLKFFNTLTRRIDELRPVRPGRVGIYACGPSLDGPPDLGLCRRMIFADLLRRYLELRGFEVKLVVNIADIDDRTVNQCLAEGAELKEFTARWEKAFHEDMAALNVLPASDYPKASEHIPEMIEETRKLLAKDLAYEKLRSVYFNISRYPNYGQLSHVDLNAIQKGKTVDFDYYEKENPSDFTLFKRASLQELKAGVYWPTPWGNCRPGWHVECACMSAGHLGQPFDIHLASSDLIFPHGDNEIAIAESLYGKPLANLWLHSEVVVVDGKKANRVQGNDVSLRELLEQGHSPQAVRYWMLSQHYRRALRFAPEQLDLAERTVRRLNDFVARLRFLTPAPDDAQAEDVDQLIYETRYRFQEAMDNDLGVAKAQGHIFAFIKAINRLAAGEGLTMAQIQKVLEFMQRLDSVLGVMNFDGSSWDPAIEELVQKREQARADGDFALADRLREQLAEMGVQVADTPSGARWHRA
ncbi:cysteine synthase [Desulfarculus baarsii DSM 2075]|uniref:Cysteine--tRNA ligase n=1 Tax=Desulfarculus baarsii (strain ATCC 33931 / DSM 2075 / LMG 7858 / VKM B-1802 / 2st14) TaxID=644282 RepID=E1QM31_DESB2|nr:cysteine--tRNA ligase [Desulfarculus baarsii]ADK86616.1 cysteine synthase [Desulfarculus baarsii DSM 2075]